MLKKLNIRWMVAVVCLISLISSTGMSVSSGTMETSGTTETIEENDRGMARDRTIPVTRYWVEQDQVQLEAVLTRDLARFRADRPAEWREKIVEQMLAQSERYEVDPLLLYALIYTESRFQPEAVGRSGEIGLMQILPSTAAQVAANSGIEPWYPERLFQVEDNLTVGLMHFSWLLKQANGNTALALARYNGGPQAVADGHPYVERVRSGYDELLIRLRLSGQAYAL